jgi:hypothetical protein
VPQNQPLSRYNVTLYHEETRERLTVGTIASSPEEAKRWARFNAALMLKEWMMSRTLAVAVKLALVVVSMLLLASCTSSTGGSGSPSLSCEQRFDRALERGVSYTEALGDYSQCLIDRGDTINTRISRYEQRGRDY